MEASESTALDYARVLWRRKWLIVAAAVAAVSVSVFVSSRATPTYTSSSRVLLLTEDSTLFGTSRRAVPQQAQVATEEQVITSPKIRRAVLAKLGKTDAALLAGVQSRAVGSTLVIEVTVTARSPEVAARAATLFAEIYTEQRQERAIRSTEELGIKLAQRTVEARKKAAALGAQLATARASRAPVSTLEELEAERETAQSRVFFYEEKQEQAAVDASLATGSAEVLDQGSVNNAPTSPRPRQSAALALALGLMLGVVAAIALDFLDDSVRTTDELARLVRPEPILAAIPIMEDWRNGDATRLPIVQDPTSTIAEAYRSLRTSVQFAGLKTNAKVLQITSAGAAEGKTTTASNLAVALALTGLRVTLIDLDLRRPRVHKFFDLPNTTGFTSLLLGDAPASDAIRPFALAGVPSLHVLPSGPLPPNPAELLGTSRVTELLASIASTSDVVLVDTPPTLPVTDSVVLSSRVDGVMVVAAGGLTSRRHLTRAIDALRSADAPLLGVVFNGAPTSGGIDYYYQQRYHRYTLAAYAPNSDEGLRSRVGQRSSGSLRRPDRLLRGRTGARPATPTRNGS